MNDEIRNTVNAIANAALDRSMKFNGDGSNNYAYAFGHFQSQMSYLLDELNLNKKQRKILEETLISSI